MPTATAERTPGNAPRFKMRLKRNEYNADLGGRLPAGAVLIVDEETAVRWLENDIAEQAPRDTPTFRQQQRAELAARLVPIADDDPGADEWDGPGGSFGPTPTVSNPTPRRRVGRGQGQRMLKRDLAGAGIINDATDTPNEDGPDLVSSADL